MSSKPITTRRRTVRRRAPAVSRTRRVYSRSTVNRQKLTGLGAYKSDKSKSKKKYIVVPEEKSDWQKTMGAQMGSRAGELIGWGIQKSAELIGLGAYEVKHNTLLGSPPVIKNPNPRGGTMIRHREFLGDITTSSVAGNFKLQSFLLGPGNPACFPWLSGIAANYEEYSFEGIIFEFRSMSADALNSTNTALGSVAMCTSYDCTNPNFSSKQEMENYEFACSGKPSCDIIHPIECAPRQTAISTELYVQPNATTIASIPANQDPRLFYWGNFQIATVGFQGTSVNIGELWVSYQVALLKPKMWIPLGNYNNIAHYSLTGASNASAFGSSQTKLQDSIGLTFSGNQMSFAPTNIVQSYMITYFVNGTAAACTFTGTTLTNMVQISTIPQNVAPAGGVVSANMLFTTNVQTTGLLIPTSVTLAFAGMPTASASAYVLVQQIPNIAV